MSDITAVAFLFLYINCFSSFFLLSVKPEFTRAPGCSFHSEPIFSISPANETTGVLPQNIIITVNGNVRSGGGSVLLVPPPGSPLPTIIKSASGDTTFVYDNTVGQTVIEVVAEFAPSTQYTLEIGPNFFSSLKTATRAVVPNEPVSLTFSTADMSISSVNPDTAPDNTEVWGQNPLAVGHLDIPQYLDPAGSTFYVARLEGTYLGGLTSSGVQRSECWFGVQNALPLPAQQLFRCAFIDQAGTVFNSVLFARFGLNAAAGPFARSIGAGQNLQFYIRRTVATGELGTWSQTRMSYGVPAIVPGSLAAAGQGLPGATSVLASSSSTGISFIASNVPTQNDAVSVFYSNQATTYECRNVVVEYNTPEESGVTCTTDPAGSGTFFSFTIRINPDSPSPTVSAAGTDVFHYPTVPQLSGIAAAGCTAVGSSGAKVECPTAALDSSGQPVELSISGTDFLQDLTATVGGLPCTGLVIVSPTLVTCTLPPSTGIDKAVLMQQKTSASTGSVVVDYRAPVLTSLASPAGPADCSPPTDPAATTELEGCERYGGALVTVTGLDFGASGGTMFIGAKQVALNHDASDPHGLATFLMPNGTGTVTVAMVQANGRISSSPLTVAYTPCAAGTIAAGLDCSNCTTGTFNPSPGQNQCRDCNPGTYAPIEGLDACLDCPEGKSQPSSGLSECSNCTAGKYQAAAGQPSCLLCPAGEFNLVDGRV